MTRIALALLAFAVLSANVSAATAGVSQEPSEPDSPASVEEEDADEYEPATFQSIWQDPEPIAARLEETLGSSMHSFCRRSGHELRPDERPLCELAEAARERCPEFAAACARTAPPKEEASGFGGTLLALLGMLGFLLFWCLIAGLVVLAVGLLVRALGLLESAQAVAPSDDEAPLVPSPKPEGFERDVALHLSRCRSLAESGDYREALAELHLAVVLSLDARGLIHARRGRTNGEYARELRPEPELGAAFREVTNTTEAVHFGGRAIDAAGFERVMARARPLLAGLSLAVLLLVSAVACSEARDVYRPSNACGTRASGNSVLCSLLELSGDVRRRYRPLDEIEEDVARIIVLPSSLDEKSWTALAAWVEGGGLAVLTTKAGSLDERFGVERNGRPCGDQAVIQDPLMLKILGYAPRLSTFGDSLGSAQLQPDALCSDGELYAGHADLGAGRVVFLPTPELLSNASLAAGENARLVMSLLSIAGGRTDIVGSWTGTASGSPFQSVSSARLWPWMLQLLVLGLAFARFRGAPFGRRTPPPEDRRRRFSEHVSALGQRWAEAGASRTALAAYAAWAFEVLRERVPSGSERGIGELSRVISNKTGRSDAEVARILANARVAQSEPALNDEKSDLDTLRRLGRLITEMGGPR